MPTSQRKGALPHTPSEDVDLDSANSFPHIPMQMPMEESKLGETDDHDLKSKSLDGDRQNIALLTFLYVLQGIPLGLAGSIPYLLQSRGISYKEQAVYSFVYWPFSIKLLWAPIVDSAFFPAFGRRKTWLVPTQYLIGIFMFALSAHVTDLLGEGEEKGPVQTKYLAIVFFCMNFLAATQDIAVDGWALTMLSRKNVGWASTCNTVGQTAGYFLGNILFLALESPDFCNSYLRSEPQDKGVVTLAGFMYFWGIVFLISTTLVMLFKHENASSNNITPDGQGDHGIVDTYFLLWKIIRLPTVMSLIGILLTVKIGFAAADSATGLKLIEAGVPKDRLAMIGVPLVPLQILLPIFISRYTTGPRPMEVFLKAMPYRLFMGLVFAVVVYWAPSTRAITGEYPFYFYVVLIVVYALHQLALFSMFVAIMAFHAGKSDPAIGGTCITMYNTFSNFGGNWPSTLALWFLDSLTWKQCQGVDGSCYSQTDADACSAAGGACATTLDGYYIESIMCAVIGLIWLRLRSSKVRYLQDLPPSHWTCL